MVLRDLKDAVMFQFNNDPDELKLYEPFIMDYLNDGYDQMVYAWAEEHVQADSTEYYPLSAPGDDPKLPEWSHRYIADYATWMIYRNGNQQKQSRGQPYLQQFQEALRKLKAERNQGVKHFINIPD